jgi:hypothetical protein
MKNLLLIIPLLFWSCIGDSTDNIDFDNIGTVNGYRPIYGDSGSMTINLEAPRALTSAGKIYSYGKLLIVSEVGKGFHIYDNTDPRNPENKMFVNVPGSNDIAMKDGILYVDNYSDLVALRIAEDTVYELKRITNVMGFSGEFPPFSGVYFECAEEGRGIVVGWESAEIENPKCYRP